MPGEAFSVAAPAYRYRHVRALARGLKVLMELSRTGRARPGEIAAETGIDRTTAYRLLETLEREGFVVRTSDDHYGLTLAVRQLSEGFTDLDHVTRIVSPELGKLLAKVLWPTDFATFEQGAMIIRETTHRFSPYSVHRSMIGKSRPTLRTAMGRAVLAAASEKERDLMLRMIAQSNQPDAAEARETGYVRAMIQETQTQGYASAVGLVDSHIGAIATAIRSPIGVAGALNLVFFRTAMTPSDAADRYLPAMRESVAAIETQIAALDQYAGTTPAN
jgi:IclR family mhp operon transcriptional activator